MGGYREYTEEELRRMSFDELIELLRAAEARLAAARRKALADAVRGAMREAAEHRRSVATGRCGL